MTNSNSSNINTTPVVVRKGNMYDSRLGGHSYALWTSGYDYEIVYPDGRRYGYQTRTFETTRVDSIATPVDFHDSVVEIKWEEIPVCVRKAHFVDLFSSGTESEMNLFVYGEEVGAAKNRINSWADAHQVHSREISLQLREELGEFESVRYVRSFSRWAGSVDHIYVVDEKWQVTVRSCQRGVESFDSYTIDDYSVTVAKEKAFGRRVARLGKAAGVPWGIAVFAGNIANDAEAVEVLKAVKAARGTADESSRWELSCGIGRRVAAIELLLGEAWQKLTCRGQRQTTTLANYLIGEEED